MSVPSKPDVAKDPPRKPRVQFNLLSILLLLSACAVWSAYRSVYLETREIQEQLPGLRKIARELAIENPDEFAAVKQLPTRYDELVWRVFVPKLQGKTAQVAVVMDDIAEDRLANAIEITPLKTAPLAAGEHEIQLMYEVSESAKLTVLIDQEPAIEIVRAKDWVKSIGHSTSSEVGDVSKSYAVDRSLELHRRRFSLKRNVRISDEPGPGILLWIDMK